MRLALNLRSRLVAGTFSLGVDALGRTRSSVALRFMKGSLMNPTDLTPLVTATTIAAALRFLRALLPLAQEMSRRRSVRRDSGLSADDRQFVLDMERAQSRGSETGDDD